MRAAGDVVTVVEGTVEHVDRGAKTIVVKSSDGTDDGTEHTIHPVGHTVVQSAKGTYHGAEGAGRDLTDGTHVAVHYIRKGTIGTADEVDHLGKGGLKETEGTIFSLDRKSKTLTVKSKDGVDNVFHLSDHAAEDAGKNTGGAAEKSAGVPVYYAEEGGQNEAHFFKTAF
jgi:hypothetical protein